MINDIKDAPIVSVVMATFNEPKEVISLAINSILSQTFTDLELLIIDDSTDIETIKTINELALDKRIIVYRESERIGFVRALNLGLRKAKGKYIARMDGDDISIINRLNIQVSFLEQNPEYAVVGGAINIMNNRGVITSQRFYPTSSFKLNMWSIFRSPFAHPTVMMRREIVDKGFLYNENFVKSEDLEFWMRLMKNNYKFYNLKNILLNFRIGEDFGNKRSGSQLKSNYRARYLNFSWDSPFRSILSLLVARIYTITPQTFIKNFYKFENTKSNSK
ncbi:MAG: glycosyltransferase [Bacteroidota bacterium]|nr:glycosyltransferase [Bacteroidota bacterium]